LARHATHFDELIDIAELKALSGKASFAKGLQLASQGGFSKPATPQTITIRWCNFI
jgi:hypothetical protein